MNQHVIEWLEYTLDELVKVQDQVCEDLNEVIAAERNLQDYGTCP